MTASPLIPPLPGIRDRAPSAIAADRLRLIAARGIWIVGHANFIISLLAFWGAFSAYLQTFGPYFVKIDTFSDLFEILFSSASGWQILISSFITTFAFAMCVVQFACDHERWRIWFLALSAFLTFIVLLLKDLAACLLWISKTPIHEKPPVPFIKG